MPCGEPPDEAHGECADPDPEKLDTEPPEELFEGIYQVGRWPIGVYPGWLRYSMTYLVPIGFAVTVPAQALTGRLGWETVLVLLGFTAVVVVFTRWFWRFGLKRYSGASA